MKKQMFSVLGLYFIYCKQYKNYRLTGQAPFYGDSLDDVIEKNRACQINFKDLKVSKDALDLLYKTLEPNPKNRISS